MQLDYYRSPCAAECCDTPLKKRRKWPVLVIFSTLIVLFFAGLVVLRVTSPEGPLFSWSELFAEFESSFGLELPEEFLPEGSLEIPDAPHGATESQDPGLTVKFSLPLAPTDPSVQMTLVSSADELSFQEWAVWNNPVRCCRRAVCAISQTPS